MRERGWNKMGAPDVVQSRRSPGYQLALGEMVLR